MHGNLQGGGGGTELNIRKLGNFENLQITIKVAGALAAILVLLSGSDLELQKMAANQSRKFYVLGIF